VHRWVSGKEREKVLNFPVNRGYSIVEQNLIHTHLFLKETLQAFQNIPLF
jgi:hypothetical protein